MCLNIEKKCEEWLHWGGSNGENLVFTQLLFTNFQLPLITMCQAAKLHNPVTCHTIQVEPFLSPCLIETLNLP